MKIENLTLIGLIISIFLIGFVSAYDQSGTYEGSYQSITTVYHGTAPSYWVGTGAKIAVHNNTEANSLSSVVFDFNNMSYQSGSFIIRDNGASGTWNKQIMHGTYEKGGGQIIMNISEHDFLESNYTTGRALIVTFSPVLEITGAQHAYTSMSTNPMVVDNAAPYNSPGINNQTFVFTYNQNINWYETLTDNHVNITIERPGGIPSLVYVMHNLSDSNLMYYNYGGDTPVTYFSPLMDFTVILQQYNSNGVTFIPFHITEGYTNHTVSPTPEEIPAKFEFNETSQETPIQTNVSSLRDITDNDLSANLIQTANQLLYQQELTGLEQGAYLYPDGSIVQSGGENNTGIWSGTETTINYDDNADYHIFIHSHPWGTNLSATDYYYNYGGGYGFYKNNLHEILEADSTGIASFTRGDINEKRYWFTS